MNKTCSTCRYWVPNENPVPEFEGWGGCIHQNLIGFEFVKPTGYEVEGIEVFKNFGCIFHADKEKKEESK